MLGLLRRGAKRAGHRAAATAPGGDRPAPAGEILDIPVGELRPGMFVAELDRPWEETPFALQGFFVRSEADIEEIARHCRRVRIDLRASRAAGAPVDRLAGRARELYALPARDDWRREEATYQRVVQLTFGLLDRIALGSGESSAAVREVVDTCVASVLANPYALALIAQMERVSAALENHAIACCALAASFGRYLGLAGRDLENLALGALLHDVGMLRLPAELVRAQTPLDAAQRELLGRHAALGSAVLVSNEYYWPAVDVAYAHHERIDGTGYPRRLAGSAIPFNARVVAIVDAYDRLTSPDSYRRPLLSPTRAMGEIYAGRGTQFDAQLVEKFIRFMGVYPLGTPVVLSSGEIAVVVEKNPLYMVLPKVRVVADAAGRPVPPRLLDLFAECQRGEGIRIRRTLPLDERIKALVDAAVAEGEA
ncbi:MAG: HD family phosphohydrolase [Porticoccaceae bacterium]|nr:MAG: HD family phosphohydrolase [Porticoccaceae bacterium]